jgi:hypothetical protein
MPASQIRRVFERQQAELRLAGSLVGAMADQAVLGQDGPNLAGEVDWLGR